MTLKELSQLYYLNREIEQDELRLQELQARATQVTQQTSGMPRGGGDQQKIERYVADIIDLKAIIAAKQQQCIHEQSRLERYIADIPDSLTRQIFQLRFISGLNWVQVAFSVGGGNTEEGVRKRVYRYMNMQTGAENKGCPKMSGVKNL